MFCIEPAHGPCKHPASTRRSTSRSASPGPSGSGGPSYPACVTGHSRPPPPRSARRIRWSPGTPRTYLESLVNFLSDVRPNSDYSVVTVELRSHVPSGQRRGRWSGVPLQDRQALRRDELIAAGVALAGRRGGPALTVRAVCRAAGLTERYFYESFTDRDEFVARRLRRRLHPRDGGADVGDSPRDAVEQFVALMVDDPVRGRVLLLAPGGEPVLARPARSGCPASSTCCSAN